MAVLYYIIYVIFYHMHVISRVHAIHSLIGGHLDCLQLLASANKSASVNIFHTSMHMCEDLSRIYTRNGIAGLKKYRFSNSTLVAACLMWLYRFKLPSAVGSLFLHVPSSTCYLDLLKFCHSDGDFSMHFFDCQRYWVTFPMCIGRKVSFSEGYLFKPFSHLLLSCDF